MRPDSNRPYRDTLLFIINYFNKNQDAKYCSFELLEKEFGLLSEANIQGIISYREFIHRAPQGCYLRPEFAGLTYHDKIKKVYDTMPVPGFDSPLANDEYDFEKPILSNARPVQKNIRKRTRHGGSGGI